MHAYGYLIFWILLSHVFESRIGQMSLCCEECSVGKLNVRVTKSKVYCWCLVPNK
ncbi:unnamed protein product [Larinioides sclopetarius]|uniref:Uncharacterized protein n=1 Tax=Larinioides sclopetarius TaxID=280406 RepID=A0AAV2B9B0_9ARAC